MSETPIDNENEQDSQRQFQIHLPGLLRILAENLYSSPKVAIRELIQNAHDSTMRRRFERRDDTYRARISVSVDADAQTITISDNGSGLTETEANEYLSTIGRSYTRQLGEKLSFLNPEQAEQLVGQFGLGFLSAFLIASEVTFVTRSMQDGAPTLRWHSTGDVHYNLESTAERPVGSYVTLKLKPTVVYLLNKDVLSETIRHYADFLDVPIYLESGNYPINAMSPPWNALDPKQSIQEYINRTYQTDQPLAIIPLHDHEIDLGHDTINLPLSGFLFIPPSSTVSLREFGDLRLFIRHMFICDDNHDMMPSWAKFVRGIVDCPNLQPTASREDIRQEDTFLLVQQALETQLIAGLHKVASEEPTAWRQIVRGHRDLIIGWAAKDNRFFEQVADIVTFRTTRGTMPLADYLKDTRNTIYYFTHDTSSLQEQIVGEGYGMPVIDASHFAEQSFLNKYASQKNDVELIQLDGDANRLLQPVSEEPFRPILDHLREQGIRVQVATFQPEAVPALMIYPKDAEFIQETRKGLANDEIPGPFAAMIGDYIGRMNVNEDSLAGTLYLNASNDLILQLEKITNKEARNAAVDVVYQMARLFAGRLLDAPGTLDLFTHANVALGSLVAGAGDASDDDAANGDDADTE